MGQNSAGSRLHRPDSGEEARAFLKEYVNRYESARRALMRTDAKSIVAKQIKVPTQVPPPSLTEIEMRGVHIHKWYRQTRDGFVKFYDDGKPLPEANNVILVTETSTVVSKERAQVQVDTWFLSRGKVRAK